MDAEVTLTFEDYKFELKELEKLADNLKIEDFDFTELRQQLKELEQIDLKEYDNKYKKTSKKTIWKDN